MVVVIASAPQNRVSPLLQIFATRTTPSRDNIAIMAHMARAHGYEDEQTDDEDAFQRRNGRGNALIGTDEYIESSPCHTLLSILRSLINAQGSLAAVQTTRRILRSKLQL
jgi:hypothetical protein